MCGQVEGDAREKTASHCLVVLPGVGQNIDTAIYRCPSSCDTIIDTMAQNIDKNRDVT